MEIRSGYFSRVNAYKELGYLPVSVSRSVPKGYKELSWGAVAPSWALLNNFKLGNISWEEYSSEYLEGLKTVSGVVEKLQSYIDIAEENGNLGIILLCWEKSDQNCHRRLLANYLTQLTGHPISEMVLS